MDLYSHPYCQLWFWVCSLIRILKLYNCDIIIDTLFSPLMLICEEEMKQDAKQILLHLIHADVCVISRFINPRPCICIVKSEDSCHVCIIMLFSMQRMHSSQAISSFHFCLYICILNMPYVYKLNVVGVLYCNTSSYKDMCITHCRGQGTICVVLIRPQNNPIEE